MAELGRWRRLGDPLGPDAHGPGRLRGRARGRHRSDRAPGHAGPRPRACPWIHLSQRRLGTGPPVRRWAVGPRQVARHVLPDGPGPRDRRRDPRPAAVGHPLPRRGRGPPGREHVADVLLGRRDHQPLLGGIHARARRRHRHRHAVGCRRVSRSAAVPPRRGTRRRRDRGHRRLENTCRFERVGAAI